MNTRFQVVPGTVAPAAAPPLMLTGIRQVYSPPRVLRAALLDRLTGVYSAIRIARLGQTWRDLRNSGLLGKLDALYIRGMAEADSLLNWVVGNPDAINQGASFGPLGLTGDGVSDWVQMGWTPTRFTQVNASMFAMVQAVTPGVDKPVICGGSPTAANARLNFTSTQAAARLNSSTSTIANYSADRTGLWSVHRAGFQSIRRNGNLIAASEIPAGSVA